MQNAKRTYRPKSGHEGATVTFPNPLTGETVDISSWPFTTESSVEMAHLDGHDWITDRPAPSGGSAQSSGDSTADNAMPLSRMKKATLEKIAVNRGLDVSPDATKKELEEAVRAAGQVPADDEETDDTGGSE